MQISQKEKKWHQQEKMKKAGEVLGPITIFANDLKFAKKLKNCTKEMKLHLTRRVIRNPRKYPNC